MESDAKFFLCGWKLFVFTKVVAEPFFVTPEIPDETSDDGSFIRVAVYYSVTSENLAGPWKFEVLITEKLPLCVYRDRTY